MGVAEDTTGWAEKQKLAGVHSNAQRYYAVLSFSETQTKHDLAADG
jgi:hypothetical protein